MGRRQHSGITDQRKAALRRKSDARELLRAGAEHTRGAMYLGGYAIECKIKAISMEVHSCVNLEQLRERLGLDESVVYAHGLEALLSNAMPAGFLDKLRLAEPVGRDFAGRVNRWRPSWRYSPYNPRVEEAREFLHAVDRVYAWLDSNRV